MLMFEDDDADWVDVDSIDDDSIDDDIDDVDDIDYEVTGTEPDDSDE